VPALGLTVHVPGIDSRNHALLTELLQIASSTASVPDPGWADLLTGQVPLPAAPVPGPSDLPASLAPPHPGTYPAPEYRDPPMFGPDPDFEDDGQRLAAGDPAADETAARVTAQAAVPVPSAPLAASAPGEVGLYLRLLGPVEIRGRTGEEQPGRDLRLTEMAVYLALYPNRGHAALAEALWPNSRGARHSDLSRLRHWLGADPSGAWFLPYRAYALRNVRSDWDVFQDRVREGNLPAALALVRDQPFCGAAADRYGWAEEVRQDMIGKIVDVAQILAEEHLAEREYSAARATAMVGLKVAPEREELSRIVIDALAHLGRLTEAEAYAARVVDLCDSLGVDPQFETITVLGRLRALRAAAPVVAKFADS
jgi:hypothetical protein